MLCPCPIFLESCPLCLQEMMALYPIRLASTATRTAGIHMAFVTHLRTQALEAGCSISIRGPWYGPQTIVPQRKETRNDSDSASGRRRHRQAAAGGGASSCSAVSAAAAVGWGCRRRIRLVTVTVSRPRRAARSPPDRCHRLRWQRVRRLAAGVVAAASVWSRSAGRTASCRQRRGRRQWPWASLAGSTCME